MGLGPGRTDPELALAGRHHGTVTAQLIMARGAYKSNVFEVPG